MREGGGCVGREEGVWGGSMWVMGVVISIVPRPEEDEEKQPGFSRLHMRFIAVEY